MLLTVRAKQLSSEAVLNEPKDVTASGVAGGAATVGSALLAPSPDATCANCGNIYMPLKSKMKFSTNQFGHKVIKPKRVNQQKIVCIHPVLLYVPMYCGTKLHPIP